MSKKYFYPVIFEPEEVGVKLNKSTHRNAINK